jgi:hypothetical protein
MKAASENPTSNQLPAGLEGIDIEAAVDASGYPLQTSVASDLLSKFDLVQPEWAYTDSDTGQIRTLDVLAQKRLYSTEQGQLYLRPELALLIECKQSEMPYVFFSLDKPPPGARHALTVAGLRHEKLTITTDDDPSSWTFPVLHALELDQDDFISNPPIAAAAMSKLARRGNKLELSGANAYSSLVLPLVKSLQDFQERQKPTDTAVYFDVSLPIALALVDGPLVSVGVLPGRTTYELVPWVRLYRHDVNLEAKHPVDRDELYALDVVHRDWFHTYLDGHVFPFAKRFGELALMHHKELASGKAFASGLGAGDIARIEQRIRPRKSLEALPKRGRGWLRHVNREYRHWRQLNSE